MRLPWRTWVCSSEDQAWKWHGCLDHRDSGGARCTGEPVATCTGDMGLLGFFLNRQLSRREKELNEFGRSRNSNTHECFESRGLTEGMLKLWQEIKLHNSGS